jgi:hypothetical protein
MDSGPPLCPQQEEMVAQRAMLWVSFTPLTSPLAALVYLLAYPFSSLSGWWPVTNLWFTGISTCLLMTVKCNQSHLASSPSLYQVYWSWLLLLRNVSRRGVNGFCVWQSWLWVMSGPVFPTMHSTFLCIAGVILLSGFLWLAQCH